MDCNVRVYELANGALVFEHRLSAGTQTVALSSDGAFVAASCDGGDVYWLCCVKTTKEHQHHTRFHSSLDIGNRDAQNHGRLCHDTATVYHWNHTDRGSSLLMHMR